MEKGEADKLSVDSQLAQWALDEGIIEPQGAGGYRFTTNSGGDTRRTSADHKDSTQTVTADTVHVETSPVNEKRPTDEMDVDT